MSEVTQAELNILQTIRELRPYEKIEKIGRAHV